MDVSQPNNQPTTSLWSWLPAAGHSRLRGIVAGALLATGMTALAAPPQTVPPRRAAWLLPPQKLEPGDVPALARGAMDDLPGASLGSTPVRSGKKSASGDGPAWLTGVDPNVLPASGILPARSASGVRTLGAGSTPPATPSATPKAYPPFPQASEKIKTPAGVERTTGPMMLAMPVAEPQQDPNMPLRGTASNGAPVMAGPPAYRWYGYGSVTPGANVYAPAGQYPKASSNWYSVTGATPGAFPVPVMHPYRTTPGNEPPTYTANPPTRSPMTAPGVDTAKGTFVPPPSRPATTVHSKPATVAGMPSIGSIGAGSMPPLPQPVGVPLMALPPTAPIAPVSELPAVPSKPEPKAGIPSVVPAMPVIPAMPKPPEADAKKPLVGLPVVASKPAGITTPAAPEPLPPALTTDMGWKPTPEPEKPVPPGTWMPVATPPGAPSLSPPDLFLEPGAKVVTSASARGQMPDSTRPDPVAALIQGVCKGRAEGIDVRWTGSKKLTVCFEVRSQPEANRLVKDVSARQELAPYAIDFCVLVK